MEEMTKVQNYVEKYRTFRLERKNGVITIYDQYNCYVTRLETDNVHVARMKIDEIIAQSR